MRLVVIERLAVDVDRTKRLLLVLIDLHWSNLRGLRLVLLRRLCRVA